MKIDNTDKLMYLERMIQPYEKKNQKKYPILQFLQGDGNELSGKFWEKKSSSRMAYDLYSWMQNDSKALDFEFEFHLPGLKSGGKGPNMDVFIETNDELIFIESKFTEKANLHYIESGYLRKAYYVDGTYGGKSLIERFHDNQWANSFSVFCIEWEKLMEKYGWHHGIDWFEPKQETCHLSGILLFLFAEENKKRVKSKKIRLYNIFWQMPGDEYSQMEVQFCERAQVLINEIIAEKNPGILDFKIDAFSVQDMLQTPNKLSAHLVFPSDVCETIIERNKGILEEEHIKSRRKSSSD